MRFKVTSIAEEEDYEMYDSMPSRKNKEMPKRIMIRLETKDKPRCSMSVPQSELGQCNVGDNIEVTFGKPNIAKV